MKKFFLILFIFLSFSNRCLADELSGNSKSAILVENETGKVLYEKNADEKLAPASLTKMMTLLLTMERVDKGLIKLNDTIRVSKNAANMGGSQVYLEENSEYTIEEIIKAVCIASGNDAAVVLAENIGGSIDNFVKMMNDKAKELHLDNTHFVNPYGLDADNHYSSARDIANLSRELLKHKSILKYTSLYEDHLVKKDGTSLWMVNTNKLVRFYNGIDGLKTGFTNNANYSISATGKFNNLRLIAVVMGEDTSENRNNDVVSMINYGKSNYKFKKIISKNKIIGYIKVNNLYSKKVPYYIKNDINKLYSSNEKLPKYTYKISLNKVNIPIKRNKSIGNIKLYNKDKLEFKEELVINKNINKVKYTTCLLEIIKKTVFSMF